MPKPAQACRGSTDCGGKNDRPRGTGGNPVPAHARGVYALQPCNAPPLSTYS